MGEQLPSNLLWQNIEVCWKTAVEAFLLQFEREQTLKNTQVLVSSPNKSKLIKCHPFWPAVCDCSSALFHQVIWQFVWRDYIILECSKSVCITAPENDRSYCCLVGKFRREEVLNCKTWTMAKMTTVTVKDMCSQMGCGIGEWWPCHLEAGYAEQFFTKEVALFLYQCLIQTSP